jgi:hypothetical protein
LTAKDKRNVAAVANGTYLHYFRPYSACVIFGDVAPWDFIAGIGENRSEIFQYAL